MSGELVGVPSVSVMTERFVSAAEMMRGVLGAHRHKFIVIDHPISSASDAELAQRAAAIGAQVVAALSS